MTNQSALALLVSCEDCKWKGPESELVIDRENTELCPVCGNGSIIDKEGES